MTYEFFASCARGLEQLLAAELRGMGLRKLRPLVSGVAFSAALQEALYVCLWSRIASRVLLVLARVPAATADELYSSVYDLPWEEHLAADGSLSVAARGTNEFLRDERYLAMRVKDAVVDRLRELTGKRPDVQRQRPDTHINVVLRSNKATVAIDLSGEPLHRRGYRLKSGAIVAPLRETLAAALLLAAGWRAGKPLGSHLPAAFLLDPLCGSGTIAIEAAMILSDRAPGLLRDYWGFTGWLGHDDELWQDILDAADQRAEQGKNAGRRLTDAVGSRPIQASDNDVQAIELARKSARLAGVADLIDFQAADLATVTLPKTLASQHGLIACNPPYGQRLSSNAQLPALYAALADLVARHPGGFDLAMTTPDELSESYLAPALPGSSVRRLAVMNGPLESSLRIWAAETPDQLEAVPAYEQPKTPSAKSLELARDSEFCNRLTKMAKHRGKWARRSSISCYRVYDADLPDYKVAIDLYQGASGTANEGQRWLHIAEYAAPASIDTEKAQGRLAEVLRFAPSVLEVPIANVFLKRRQRSRGGSQYANLGYSAKEQAAKALVCEGGLLFEIDLASRLDTGIFLDHRLTRADLRQRAAGRDCLNLFAYTGTASVYMAAGGAKSVTTVDLSRNYLDWAKRNMALNGLHSSSLTFVQADALRWLDEQRHGLRKAPISQATTNTSPNTPSSNGAAAAKTAKSRKRFGLVFVDVPTFSNSARMGSRSWDVQRDHAELLIAVSRLLTADGEAVFSTNLRSFKPDTETLGKAHVELTEITANTMPADFHRKPPIHHCYILKREA
ncbi:MAG: bifunctional 23S rRNA (guanine(2069)-N(7))-methyltransferase RlmK/23S rRNA (guanine(2445)-N(2))-methyltransferase RlmL [Actinomycetia bacterium]|nr:bifunctional 23S rRNA (guanine(2069)-N(7))-methyltransferase RlmK/23S rRNA (guanine(2445)-N(2))-methyltransferase RlmL [Actinomycetes bacterium]